MLRPNMNQPALRPITGALTVLAICAALVPRDRAAAQSSLPGSIWDGVYTEAQALRGEDLYPDTCSRCHGDDLEGDEAPALRSEEFLKDWKGHTLGDLFKRVHDSMPYDRPGSISSAQTADVIAYIFSRNRVPAGRTPMSTDLLVLRQMRIDK